MSSGERPGALDRLDAFTRSAWLALPPAVRLRLPPVVVGAGTAGVLGVATWLDPDPSGHGTHLQLGLQPCTILTATGYPCPVCGATTSFALWAHLRPLDAIATQPFASLLFVLTLFAFGLSVVDLVDPRARWPRLINRLAPYELPLAGAFLAAMIAGWIYKILVMT